MSANRKVPNASACTPTQSHAPPRRRSTIPAPSRGCWSARSRNQRLTTSPLFSKCAHPGIIQDLLQPVAILGGGPEFTSRRLIVKGECARHHVLSQQRNPIHILC